MLKNLMGETGRSTGLLILRLTAGILMATHGAGKMSKVFAGDFAFGDPIGLGPHISLIGAALSEFVFALAVAAGVQIIRAHDVRETVQAMRVAEAVCARNEI